MSTLNKFILFTITLVFCFIYFYSPLPSEVNTVRLQIADIIYLPLNIVSNFYEYMGALFNIGILQKENKELKNKLVDLRKELFLLDELRTENEKLRRLLNLSKNIGYKSIPAEIISRQENEIMHVAVLDKGRKDGIRKNYIVLSQEGIVGKVIETSHKVSKIVLLNDPDFKIAAEIKNKEESGLIVGAVKKNRCVLKYIPRESKVAAGDLIVSKKSNKFVPGGLLIGKVVKVSNEKNDFFKEIIVQTEANLGNTKFVLCLEPE